MNRIWTSLIFSSQNYYFFKWCLFSKVFRPKFCSHVPHACYMSCSSHLSWCDHFSNTRLWLQITKLLTRIFSPFSSYIPNNLSYFSPLHTSSRHISTPNYCDRSHVTDLGDGLQIHVKWVPCHHGMESSCEYAE